MSLRWSRTCPRPAVFLDYAWQLRGVRRLLENGVQVRSLRRLHARVLLVDGNLATLGSQNFTRYGQGSKEATAAPTNDLEGSKFVSKLDEWFEEADDVELDFIEQLLEQLAPQMKQFRSARNDLETAFDEVHAEEEARREAEADAQQTQRDREQTRSVPLKQSIMRAAARTPYRSGQATAYASLDWDGTYEYKTFKGARTNDLTTWHEVFGDWVLNTIHLQPGEFYPVLLGPSGRMAFVRVMKTRISYVWRGVSRGSAQIIAGERLWLMPGFPDYGLEDANLTITAQPSREASAGYKMRLRFDGTEVTPADGWGVVGDLWDDELERIVKAAFAEVDQRRALLRGVFAPVAHPRGLPERAQRRNVLPRGPAQDRRDHLPRPAGAPGPTCLSDHQVSPERGQHPGGEGGPRQRPPRCRHRARRASPKRLQVLQSQLQAASQPLPA